MEDNVRPLFFSAATRFPACLLLFRAARSLRILSLARASFDPANDNRPVLGDDLRLWTALYPPVDAWGGFARALFADVAAIGFAMLAPAAGGYAAPLSGAISSTTWWS